MNKKQTIQIENSGAHSSFSRKLFSVRFWLMVFLVALCLICFETPAYGQVECFDKCQSGLAGCLQSAHGDAAAEAGCQDQYDDCGEGCIYQ